MLENKEIGDIVKIEYAAAENALFTEKKGFVSLEFTSSDGQKKSYEKIKLQRNFPNDKPFEYISVLDGEDNEICLIKNIDDFGEETSEILRRDLERRYYVFVIRKILSVNQRYGYSYWKIETDEGLKEFTVQDTYRNFRKLSADRATISDIDGNRYEIPSLEGLDKRSMRKIELFI